ncbi:GNAT family N-acetyltransferase [Oleidesulfovibrio alaskensis]|uniref:GNAT family N-acetyltransferase n=1 Tax=Oleidesulfovibrio alaskensis TaxID=58180 RepID=UPI00041039FC|nr:GNAT family N-acetyltransferase [Oleidesulfovibrio alaskensis]MBL3583681.1 GNAT family N-acetyltransferase [Oleidesulfovibrio alaskensis]
MPLYQPLTPRLFMRQWRAGDLPCFARMNADRRVMRFFPAPLTRRQSDAMAERCSMLIDSQGWGFWAVEERSSGLFAGMVGLHRPSGDLPFAPCVEVGWRLDPDHWGKGYATEAAAAALDIAFNTLGLHEVVAFTAVLNTPSQAVMRRLGMRHAMDFEHPAVPADSPLRAHCLYRTDKEEHQRRHGL